MSAPVKLSQSTFLLVVVTQLRDELVFESGSNTWLLLTSYTCISTLNVYTQRPHYYILVCIRIDKKVSMIIKSQLHSNGKLA